VVGGLGGVLGVGGWVGGRVVWGWGGGPFPFNQLFWQGALPDVGPRCPSRRPRLAPLTNEVQPPSSRVSFVMFAVFTEPFPWMTHLSTPTPFRSSEVDVVYLIVDSASCCGETLSPQSYGLSPPRCVTPCADQSLTPGIFEIRVLLTSPCCFPLFLSEGSFMMWCVRCAQPPLNDCFRGVCRHHSESGPYLFLRPGSGFGLNLRPVYFYFSVPVHAVLVPIVPEGSSVKNQTLLPFRKLLYHIFFCLLFSFSPKFSVSSRSYQKTSQEHDPICASTCRGERLLGLALG